MSRPAGLLDPSHNGFVDTRVRLYDGAGRLVAVLTREEFRARRQRCGLHPNRALRPDGSCAQCAFDAGGRLGVRA